MAILLEGAHFELHDSSGLVVVSATSGADGVVDLGNVSPGTYSLVEVSAPSGFVVGGPYTAVVAADGTVTINDTPMANFTAENYPYPNVEFAKTDTAGSALSGAVFQLSDSAGTNLTTTSDMDGKVIFYTVKPGDYELTELTPPIGYIKDDNTYAVAIDQYGGVTVNGNPITEFSVANADGPNVVFTKTDNTPQSEVPTMSYIDIGYTKQSGTGIPQSTINIVWNDGTTTSTTTVDFNGDWSADVPAGVTLVYNQYIHATQTTPGKTVSEDVSNIIHDLPT